MLKFLYMLTRPAERPESGAGDAFKAEWINDPLSHPAIRRMGEKELADLPFATRFARNRCEDSRPA